MIRAPQSARRPEKRHIKDYTMNILVTGANGQLGRAIRLVCVEPDDTYIFTDVHPSETAEIAILDITDAEAVRKTVREKGVRCIVNCAAYTDVDKAETEMTTCCRLNAEAPGILAGVMKETSGLLIHISTDYVFGADPYNTPCQEDRQGTPTGVYGSTKLEGENNIRRTGCDHVIIRTSWLYSEHGKNFVKKMLDLTSSRARLQVVFDQAGTPTYACDLAEAIKAVIADYRQEDPQRGYSKNGIYNYSDEGVCSWYDFAKAIAEYSGHTSCEILPCHSDEFPSPVKRPAYSVLDKTRIKCTFGLHIPYWTDSLKKCIKNLETIQHEL